MKRMLRLIRRNRRKTLNLIVWFLALTAAGIMLLRAADAALQPVLREAARMQAGRLAEDALNQALQAAVSASAGKELVSLHAENGVTVLHIDAAGAAEVRMQASAAGLRMLSSLKKAGLRIPLGSALGIGILSGRGPVVRAAVFPVGTVSGRIVSSFEEAGVNQTCHRLTLALHADVAVLLPGDKLSFTVETSAPLCETVLIGSVPAVYVRQR